MKDIIEHVSTENCTYPIVFNLNVMESLQEEYESIEKWGEITCGEGNEPRIKEVKFGIKEMINEAIDIENEKADEPQAFVTDKQVGRIISEIGIKNIMEKVRSLTLQSSATGEEEKNA